MLRQMARHADHLLGERDGPPQMRVAQIEPGLFDPAVLDLLAPASPMGRGDRRGDVFGQAHHLADLADRAARAVMDHRRRDPGAVAAVFLVDVLDHLLAPLMLEIDVDVGRLLALLAK